MSDISMAIVGGVLIGSAAVWLYLSIGRIAGVSGIAAQALRSPLTNSWAVLFILGLGLGGWAAQLLGFGTVPTGTAALTTTPVADLSLPLLIAGGLLVGVGTRLGSGCTSGHGVCGMARLSPRSLAATLVFVGVGMVAATLVHSA